MDAFKIGVTIAMATTGTHVLTELTRHLMGVQAGAAAATASMAKLRTVALGALGVFAGKAALEGIWGIVKASEKLNEELLRTKQLGGEFARNLGAARATAFENSRLVPTSTPSENVRMLREIGAQGFSFADAQRILPHLAKFAYVLEHYSGGTMTADQATAAALKTLDLRGQIFSHDGTHGVDVGMLMKELDAMSRGIRISGGMLKPNDFLQFARQAGLAGKVMDPMAFYALSAEAMMAMGSSRTGTAMTSLFQQMIGGTMPLRVAKEMEAMGLLRSGEWKSGKGGNIVMSPQATERFKALAADPFAWIENTLVPMLQAKGMKGNDLLMEVFRLFGRQTTQRLVGEIIQNQPQFARARTMFGDVLSTGDTYKMLQNESLTANMKALHAAWTGFMEALGTAAIPHAIVILQKLTSAIQFLTKAAEEHPTAAAILMDVAAGFAALVALSGGLAILGASLGPLAAGLRLLIGLSPVASAAAGVASGAVSGGLASGALALGSSSLALGAGVLAGAAGVAGGMYLLDINGYGANPRPVLSTGASRITNAPVGTNLWGDPNKQYESLPVVQWFKRMVGMTDGKPVPVVVTNGRDLADGVTGVQERQLQRRTNSGTTMSDFRFAPGGAGSL